MILKEHELYKEVHPTKNTHVNVDKLKYASNKKIWWICSQGHEFESKVANRTINNRGCKYCTGQVPIIGVNDLKTKNPTLASQLQNPSLATDLFEMSNKKVSWVCDKKHVWDSSVSSRTLGSGCPYCYGRLPIVGETDINTTDPNLANQLKDQSFRYTLMRNSAKKVWWVCSNNHEWLASPNNRSKGSGCPYCSGRLAIAGSSDLKTTHPKMFNQLVLKDSSLKMGSIKKVDWVCEEGHNFSSSPNHRTREGRTYEDGCPKCGNIVSKTESFLVEFIKKNYTGLIETSNRSVLKPKELDIYLPELKVAIEFNGVYFHSEKFKDKDYHKIKADMCAEKGIQLITVWEDDYNLRRDIVHRMILHKLGLSQEEKVPARKTEVVVLKNHEAFPFLKANHIQGKASGTYYLGLKTQSTQELVAVMVLKRSGDTLTLERYATSCIVSGGQSKLLSYVDKNIKYSKMVTFADRTISSGDLYGKTGWTREAEIDPDYRYLVKSVREHKFGYRKIRFKNDPTLKYEEGLTEKQLAELNGLLRVYDAGKVRFSRKPQFHGRISN